MRRKWAVPAVLVATVLALTISGHFLARRAVEQVYRACGGGEHVPTRQLAYLRAAVEAFRRDHGRYPARLAELGAPPDGPPYLEGPSIETDLWGRPWLFHVETRPDGVFNVRLGTAGPDGAPGSDDDYVARWMSTAQRVGKIRWGP